MNQFCRNIYFNWLGTAFSEVDFYFWNDKLLLYPSMLYCWLFLLRPDFGLKSLRPTHQGSLTANRSLIVSSLAWIMLNWIDWLILTVFDFFLILFCWYYPSLHSSLHQVLTFPNVALGTLYFMRTRHLHILCRLFHRKILRIDFGLVNGNFGLSMAALTWWFISDL